MTAPSLYRHYTNLIQDITKDAKYILSPNFYLFIVILRIAESETEDPIFLDFLEKAKAEEETLKYLVYEKMNIAEQGSFHNSLVKLLQHFSKEYDAIENILQKNYFCDNYFFIKYYQTEKKIKTSKFFKNFLKLQQNTFFPTILFNLEKLDSSSEVIDLNEKCIKFIHNFNETKKYNYKEDYIDIVKNVLMIFSIRRQKSAENIHEYNIIDDYTISIYGNLLIQYLQLPFYKRRPFNQYISLYDQKLKIELISSILQVIELEEISCEICNKSKSDFLSLLDNMIDYISSKENKKLKYKLLKKNTASIIKPLEVHLKAEHKYSSSLRIRTIFSCIYIPIIIVIFLTLFFHTLSLPHLTKSFYKGLIAIFIFAGIFLYYILYNFILNKMSKKHKIY